MPPDNNNQLKSWSSLPAKDKHYHHQAVTAASLTPSQIKIKDHFIISSEKLHTQHNKHKQTSQITLKNQVKYTA